MFVDLEQGSPAWHQWRAGVLGASDAGTILGLNPWKTPEKLWKQKKGLLPWDRTSKAMERGTRLEPLARSAFELETGYDMPPICAVAKEYPFISASLDGYTSNHVASHILEIKCGESIYGKIAGGGPIPPYYEAQVQQQLMVTGAERCYFWAFDPEQGGKLRLVDPDVDFQAKLLDALVNFHASLRTDEPPTPSDVRADDIWRDAVADYLDATEDLETVKAVLECHKERLIQLAAGNRTRGGGVLVAPTKAPSPRIDWERAAKDLADKMGESIEWETYRPAAVSSEPVWKITKEK